MTLNHTLSGPAIVSSKTVQFSAHIFSLFTSTFLIVVSVLALAGCGRRELVPLPNRMATDLRLPLPREVMLDRVVDSMRLESLIGQLLIIGIDDVAGGEPVTEMSLGLQSALEQIQPAGIVLFSASIQTPAQVQDLILSCQGLTRIPLLVAADNEGGNVSRLTASEHMPATRFPSATLLGEAAGGLVRDGKEEAARLLAERWGSSIAAELRALGIFMNFGPVADVDSDQTPGLLGLQRRTFSSDPALVARLTAASVGGMLEAGVIPVMKHFPGQGAATGDPHESGITLDHTAERLSRVDLVPFEAGIKAGSPAIMTAHVSYPGITGTDLPATVSHEIIGELLRRDLGFQGVVVTDALNMDAVSSQGAETRVAVQAIQAGADLLLKPRNPVEVHAGLVNAVRSGMLSRERVEESVRRILEIKIDVGLFGPAPHLIGPNPESVLGNSRHQTLVQEIRDLARRARE